MVTTFFSIPYIIYVIVNLCSSSSICLLISGCFECIKYRFAQLIKNTLRDRSILLLNVNTPYVIQHIRYVNAYSSILCQLSTLLHAKPSTPNNETIISINVEPLLCSEVFYASNQLLVVIREIGGKRKDKWFYMNQALHSFTIVDCYSSFPFA